jgi:predicted metal-dependent hydrolase
MTDSSKTRPREYLEGIEHFNAGHYYEAHEAWEDIWLRSSRDEKLFYQVLIQVAASLYHHNRGNLRGCERLYRAAKEKLARLRSPINGLDLADFSRQLEEFFSGKRASRPQIKLLDER